MEAASSNYAGLTSLLLRRECFQLAGCVLQGRYSLAVTSSTAHSSMQSIGAVQESCVLKERKLKGIRLTLPSYTAFPLKEEGWREWCFGFDLFLICFQGAQDILSLSPSQMKTLMSFVDNRRQIPKSMNINWQELGYEMEELRFALGLIHNWPTAVLLQWV